MPGWRFRSQWRVIRVLVALLELALIALTAGERGG
jgi:hypothetical protein